MAAGLVVAVPKTVGAAGAALIGARSSAGLDGRVRRSRVRQVKEGVEAEVVARRRAGGRSEERNEALENFGWSLNGSDEG